MPDARDDAAAGDAHRPSLDRVTLDVRTVTVSLRSALADLGADPTMPASDRVALRQAWRARANALLDGVESRWRDVRTFVGPDASHADVAAIEALIERARHEVEHSVVRVVAWATSAVLVMSGTGTNGASQGNVMEDARARTPRTCVRCGRHGVNAFRPAVANVARSGWICTHDATCLRRMRSEHRLQVRTSGGRPRTSPIAPPDLADKPAAVIGSRSEDIALIARLLEVYLGMDVSELGLVRRSLDVVSRRDLGVVVVDLHVDDPVAVLNELGRRLAMARRRGLRSVVCHSAGHTGPAIERLVTLSGAKRVLRPYDAETLITGVIDAAGTGLGTSVGTSAAV